MFKMNAIRAAVAAVVLGAVGAASAAVITLDFEGLANGAPVGNFYNGGAGTNYGVQFSPDTLALVDKDAGGTGNFANEPSGDTIMFFLSGSAAILNYAAGFDTGFSFFYTSSTAATVNVYDGLDGTGNILGSIELTAQGFSNCSGDPTGEFCNFSAVGVAFAGIARSINFGGTPDQTGFDNITFGSSTPGGGTVPEPTTLALVGAALLGAAAARRRKA